MAQTAHPSKGLALLPLILGDPAVTWSQLGGTGPIGRGCVERTRILNCIHMVREGSYLSALKTSEVAATAAKTAIKEGKAAAPPVPVEEAAMAAAANVTGAATSAKTAKRNHALVQRQGRSVISLKLLRKKLCPIPRLTFGGFCREMVWILSFVLLAAAATRILNLAISRRRVGVGW